LIEKTDTFPKGETAVLTMIEKDYGEQFIEPAKAFIEQIGAKFEESKCAHNHSRWKHQTQANMIEYVS
jgi:hypothetical protein